MKIKGWMLAALGVAVVAFFYFRRRGTSPGEVAVNSGKSKADFEQNPRQAAVDATQDAIDRATKAAQAIRKDPGIAALLGLGKADIDRIVLSPDSYAGLYNLRPTSGVEVVR